MKHTFEINGVSVEAEYSDVDVQNVFVPLLQEIARKKAGVPGRMLVFLAAPPAAGKSTLTAFLAHLAKSIPGFPSVQALGMDGFHHHADYIAAHTAVRGGKTLPMARVKGAPESFDVEKLQRTLCAIRRGEPVRFPAYDRRLHDVVEDAVEVSAPLLLIEGNWLLLDEPVWRDLPHDYAIFLNAPEALAHDRLIQRRLRTGRTRDEAETLWTECDGPNVRLCRTRRIQADVLLELHQNGTYTRVK